MSARCSRAGRCPTHRRAAPSQLRLGHARTLAFERLSAAGDALLRADGCDALRAILGHGVPGGEDEGLHLAATVAVAAAAWARTRAGAAPLAPDPTLPHAADYLRMVRGAEAPAALVRGLDTYLVTVSDHGMNASTFTARVVASTGSDATSAIVAALGALKGPLHGGAPGPVLDMLDAIGSPENAAPWLEGELAAGRRVMGMGHRVYRVRDPRAAVLERATTRLVEAGIQSPRLALARAVEEAALGVLRRRHPTRPLLANVEFYTAVLLDALGLSRTLFTPTFAAGRVLGWYAHVLEQRRVGRLIRPASRYVGPTPPAT
jgi:citrate synthase